jgi:hypothetical protein
VSDDDREAVVGRLRLAHLEGRLDLDEFGDRVGLAYGARSARELGQLVVDLPAVPPPPEPPGAGRSSTRWVVGVFGGARRRGRWRPAGSVRAVAVLGSAVVDLTEVDLSGGGPCGDRLEVLAVAVLGGIEVLVPEGVDVELDGVAILGSKDCRVRSRPPVPGAPVVWVRARAVFGGVTVRSHRFRRLPDPSGSA